jgi:hypothetical protein
MNEHLLLCSDGAADKTPSTLNVKSADALVGQALVVAARRALL